MKCAAIIFEMNKIVDVRTVNFTQSETASSYFVNAVCCFVFLFLFLCSMRNNTYRAESSVTVAGSLHLILSEFVCYFIVPDSSAHAT